MRNADDNLHRLYQEGLITREDYDRLRREAYREYDRLYEDVDWDG